MFYKQVLKEHPGIGPANIWNCDESGFPTDPSKGKVISHKVRIVLSLYF